LAAHIALARAAHVTFRHSGISVAQLLQHRPFDWTFLHAVAGGEDLAMFSLVQDHRG
jgi:hypothetical protein